MNWFGFPILFLLTCALGVYAQAQISSRPDFSGTWTMENASRSLDPTEKDVIIERTAPNLSAITLTISNDGSDIKVLRNFTFGDETEEQHLKYHTDGRGETNPGIRSGKRTFHTRTRWSKDRLVITFDSYTASISGQPIAAYRQVEWRLVDNGTQLVETDTTSFSESKLIDSSVASSDRRRFSMVPPRITVRRIYRRVA
jgi:hypothetical protein